MDRQPGNNLVFVAGATTETGRELVPKLIRRGQQVRVMVRKEVDARAFAVMGADVVQADLRDREAVRQAVCATATLISLVGRHFASSQAEFWEIEVGGAKTLVDAACAAGVKRFVMLSALWSDRDLEPFLFRAKRQAEDALITSGLRYTILRPSMFALGPNSMVGGVGPLIERYGVAIIPGPDTKPISVLTLDDLSDALLTASLNCGEGNHIYELGGPEAITLGEGVRRIAAHLGKKARIVRVPRTFLRWLRSISRFVSFAAFEKMLFVEMLADHGFACTEGRNQLAELLGRMPQSFQDALHVRYGKAGASFCK